MDENEWLWLTKRQMRFLQQYLDEIKGIWLDQAANKIMKFFLLPFQDENAQMERFFELAYSGLQEIKHLLKKSKEQRLKIATATESIETSLRAVTEAIDIAEREYVQFMENELIGESYLPGIEDCIRRAYFVGRQYIGSNGDLVNSIHEYRSDQQTQSESATEQNNDSQTKQPSSKEGVNDERF